MVVMRVIAVVSLAVGTAALALAGWGLMEGPDFVRNLAALMRLQELEMDAADWLFRWRLSLVVVGAAGGTLLVSGLAILRGRRWGLLTVSAAALCVAAFPWILRVTAGTRYQFEAASLLETSVLLTVAAMSAGGYFWTGRGVAA